MIVFMIQCHLYLHIMNKIEYLIILIFLLATSCSEEEISNRYTFTGETVADYMLNRSEKYSHFINILKRAELFSLLQTYGQYTLFLPDNETMKKYMQEQDSIYWATIGTPQFINTEITSPLVEELSDSMANVLARTHLLSARFHTADMGEGAMGTRNFNKRYLGVNYKATDEDFHILINNLSAITHGDNEVENGIIHIVDRVIPPTQKNIAEQIASCSFFKIFTAAINETRFCDSLRLDMDNTYLLADAPALGYNGQSNMAIYPKSKHYKYTAFVEADDVFAKNGIYTLDDLKAFAERWYGTEDKETPHSPKNALYKFVAYHFVRRELIYNELVPHNIDKYHYNSEHAMLPGTARYDYFETMAGNIIKVEKPLDTVDGANVYINYNRRESPFNKEMHSHLSVRVVPLSEFTASKEEYSLFNQMAHNGIIHPIDKILVYNEDEMAGNILNERIRIDAASLIPELHCNAVRFNYPSQMPLPSEYNIPNEYSNSIHVRSGRLLYDVGVSSYFGDILRLDDVFDVSFRLPPLPNRTYEIRFGYYVSASTTKGRNLVQVYVDGKVASLPEDIGVLSNSYEKGWIADSDTYDNGAENDKQMRLKGYMKAPDVFRTAYNASARDDASHFRRKVSTQYIGNGDHWIRFRNISDNKCTLELDYIELVPFHIVSDPTKPEDRY